MADTTQEGIASQEARYVGDGHVDLREISEILLAYDDNTFMEELIRVVTSTDTRFPTQQGPRVLQREAILARVVEIMADDRELYEGVFLPGLRGDRRFNVHRIEDDLRQRLRKQTPPRPKRESLTQLLAADIPPPAQMFEGLMHEGLLLFGGKSKRGKSWLMFDLAISLSVGRAAFRHYACPEKRSVLYLALEDGRARLQGRTKLIQPNLTHADNFHLMYSFPALNEGGIELLTHEIQQEKYGLVVIDVLAKLERPAAGKNEKSYHDIYDLFGPLQELRQKHLFCLAMLTHLRKQDAEDIFDTLMGSVAYQGAQDVLWVLERKPKDDLAFLHIRDKDGEDKVIGLKFVDGHWEYVGEGDEYEMSRDERKIRKVLVEEDRELGIEDIRKLAGFKDNQYQYVRNLLVKLVKEDLVHRANYGKYSATVKGKNTTEVEERYGEGRFDGPDDPHDVDEQGDRVPF